MHPHYTCDLHALRGTHVCTCYLALYPSLTLSAIQCCLFCNAQDTFHFPPLGCLPLLKQSALRFSHRSPVTEGRRLSYPWVKSIERLYWARHPLASGSQVLTFLDKWGSPCASFAHQEPCEQGPVVASKSPPISLGTFYHRAEAPALLGRLLLPKKSEELAQGDHPSGTLDLHPRQPGAHPFSNWAPATGWGTHLPRRG